MDSLFHRYRHGPSRGTPSLPLLRDRLKQFGRSSLARDITLVLLVKAILLMAVKYAFFSHPQAPRMELPPAAVARAILSMPAALPDSGDVHHAQ